MSGFEALSLILTAAAAGAINAVAGGGTMLTFPALLFFGTPTIVANATSTVALVIGTAGSIYGFRQQLAAVRPWLMRFVPASALGGWLGSLLLTRTEETTFARLVPFLILFATLLFLAQDAFRRMARDSVQQDAPASGHGLWLSIGFQFAVAIYGGYFGAGIGILMLASLGFIGLRDIHEMNALKNVLGSLINLVAAAWFIASGLIDWPKAAVMTGGALVGYFVGAHFSQQIPQARVRQLITSIGLLLSAVMFYQQFFA
jgi:uncharacterized membrane protein YfcA